MLFRGRDFRLEWCGEDLLGFGEGKNRLKSVSPVTRQQQGPFTKNPQPTVPVPQTYKRFPIIGFLCSSILPPSRKKKRERGGGHVINWDEEEAAEGVGCSWQRAPFVPSANKAASTPNWIIPRRLVAD
ncbi:hypothetical protein CDAR_107451 [Caerostris darwini]|uniref:Uncharacterized protein n=1 Tax=Caerostris darwini TaxID=1538125 RepID=A0AAV4NE92_9ARAC|nr:hypothetical protein CDAR_107451 [Caerostris darwini]